MPESFPSPNPPESIPHPPPRTRKTRFVCISDTHNASAPSSFQLPRGDVLLHAGDLSNQGSISELRKTLQWIEDADFEAKIIVAGTSLRLAGISFLLIPCISCYAIKRKYTSHTVANSCTYFG
jgi:hypothetical protein